MKLSCPLQGCHSSVPIGSPDGIVLAIVILALIVCVGFWLTQGPHSKNDESEVSWHSSERFPSFLRWLTRFADHLGIQRKRVSLPMAYHYYRRGLDPFETFKIYAGRT